MHYLLQTCSQKHHNEVKIAHSSEGYLAPTRRETKWALPIWALVSALGTYITHVYTMTLFG